MPLAIFSPTTTPMLPPMKSYSIDATTVLMPSIAPDATMMASLSPVAATLASEDYVKQALQIPGMKGAVAKVGASGNPAAVAAAVEFVLEGLHLNRKLNKDRGDARATFHA